MFSASIYISYILWSVKGGKNSFYQHIDQIAMRPIQGTVLLLVMVLLWAVESAQLLDLSDMMEAVKTVSARGTTFDL